MSSLNNKRIVLGVTGGIAAYKSPDIVRKLRQAGVEVRVVMTNSAKEFITPLTLQAVSGFPVHDDLFDPAAEAAMGHIALARWADLVLIAPATADTMAKLAAGQADDLLTTLCLATAAPIAIAPAMNQQMWKNLNNTACIEVLKKRGVKIFGPAEGSQACGDIGPGRMLEPEQIVADLEKGFLTDRLSDVNVLITAGPTQESLDPVRYLTNHSSGKMGYALAQAAVDAGATVTLVTGPVNLDAVDRVKMCPVITAEQMLEAVQINLEKTDIFIAVAAVCDFRAKQNMAHKIKKSNENMQIELIANPDILRIVAQSKQRPKVVVGFAAESENLLDNARKKLISKNLDLVVANNIVQPGLGFGSDDNQVCLITAESCEQLTVMSKQRLANELITKIAKIFNEKKHTN